jgi:hypothetical protein
MSKTLHGQVLTFPNIAKAIAELRGISTADARNEMCGVLVDHVRRVELEVGEFGNAHQDDEAF